jgi:hypothetical protein
MQRVINLKYVLLSLLNFIVLTVLCNSLIHPTFTESPSFHRQQIIDDRNDWINLETRNFTKIGDRSTDILAVDYSSNGKFLNATLWLFFPFKEKPLFEDISYGMLIDADFDDKTGFDGIDYKFEISWKNQTQNWFKVLEAWSPYGETRVLNNQTIPFTLFSEKGSSYVLLSCDLNDISPEKYKVLFYGEIKKIGRDPSITDFTRWVAIPPLDLDISTSPSSVDLRKGEEKTIEVKVNSTHGYEPIVNLSSKIQSNDIKLDFKQNKTVRIPSYGVATIPLTITSSDDARIGPYTLFILANSTFPSQELIKPQTSSPGFLPPSVKPENKITQSSLLITLQEPITLPDQIKEFWSKVGDPLSFFYGILAGISPWIFTKIKERIKKE